MNEYEAQNQNFGNQVNNKNGNNRTKLIITLAILIALILVFWFFFVNKQVQEELSPDYIYTIMEKWQVPVGFPVDVFLMTGEVEYLRGEDTMVNSQENHKVLEFLVSNENPEELFNKYKETLTNEVNQWQLMSENNDGKIMNLVFSRAGGIMAVSIFPNGDNFVLNITYITRI